MEKPAPDLFNIQHMPKAAWILLAGLVIKLAPTTDSAVYSDFHE
jgi:hypothetical protein